MKWPRRIVPARLQSSRIDPRAPCFRPLRGQHLVVWYGLVGSSRRGQSPWARVQFAKVSEDGSIEDRAKMEIDIAIPLLDVFRLGSVWKHHMCVGSLELDEAEFDVSFEEDGWEHVSIKVESERRKSWALEFASAYPLKYKKDMTYILEFASTKGPRVLVPCLEFYSKLYGASSELRRVLVTYPWSEATSRLFSREPPGIGEAGEWVVPLGRYMTKQDALMLAYIKHSPYARKAVKRLYSQFEVAAKANSSGMRIPSFPLKVLPWWQGSTKLLVRGFWLAEGESFMALRILGARFPASPPLILIYPEPEPGSKSSEQNAGTPEEVPQRVLRLPSSNDMVSVLTQGVFPDHSGGTSVLDLGEMKNLGRPPPIRVIRYARESQGTVSLAAGTEGRSASSKRLSTEQPYGAGKEVGKAVLLNLLQMESKGTLRDMWNAARYLCRCSPEILSVDWYDASDGAFKDGEPQMVAVNPVPSTRGEGWAYIDRELGVKRGMLIMRIRTRSGPVFIAEIQRRPLKGAENEVKEEPFKGLVFRMENETDIHWWVEVLVREICTAQGRMDKVAPLCPGDARTFKHSASKRDMVPRESAVRNALRKLGILLSGEKLSNP